MQISNAITIKTNATEYSINITNELLLASPAGGCHQPHAGALPPFRRLAPSLQVRIPSTASLTP